jgi:hypothetical protein
MKIWFYIFAAVIFLMISSMSFSQEEQGVPETQSWQGTVTQADSVGSFLVISDGSQQLRFSVDPAAKIQSGTEDIMLDEIKINDNVTVEYYKTSDGVLKVVSITDNNIAAGY